MDSSKEKNAKTDVGNSSLNTTSSQPVASNPSPPSNPCAHHDYSVVNTSPPFADGIEETFSRDYNCKTCNKRLATQYSCISATWADVYDKPWAYRVGIKEIEY